MDNRLLIQPEILKLSGEKLLERQKASRFFVYIKNAVAGAMDYVGKRICYKGGGV